MNKRLRKKKFNDNYKMELGNLFFGNSRGNFPVPREWTHKFCNRLEEMGFDSYGFYEEATNNGYFENEVFKIRPYYWGNDMEIAKEPNFIYKPTGYELCWYKYPLRDSYGNKNITFTQFATMLKCCVGSMKK